MIKAVQGNSPTHNNRKGLIMEISDELQEKLNALAFQVTENFCYSCYKVVQGDSCPTCGSDDFMRHLEGVGVEYGTGWVIEHLIKEHCNAVDAEEEFEEMLDECYPPVKVGSCEWNAGYVLRELDPVAFRCGISDYFADTDQFTEVDGEYYRVYDIENMIDELTE
jgi:hypothetical protein